KNNPAIARLCKKHWICDIENAGEVKKAIEGEQFDLGFSSPDGTLAAGVTDALKEHGMKVASPTKAASRIEWDKSFMRNLMKKHSIEGIPRIELPDSPDAAKRAVGELGEVAVKPLGLTGGKGVRISGEHFSEPGEICSYCDDLIKKDGMVLIEEKLVGEEFTLQAFCDGNTMAVMPPVQDHKRAFEGDRGPNTGGMGSYSTGMMLPFLREQDIEQAKKIMQHVLDAMKAEGAPFTGVLYGQFMATKEGVKVIEFNARLGDPEAMNVLSLLESSLSELFLSMADGSIKEPRFSDEATVVKYLVPEWYPDSPAAALQTLDTEVSVDLESVEGKGAKVYYASVFEEEGKIHVTTSRSFGVLGKAKTVEDAERIAESACAAFSGPLRHRKDIGTEPLIRKRVEHMKELRGS
ncbi:TPA: phosphoribosylamine--glycine ligase, partial [Candidatus Micrarchaeota archaeon]|nr:phosphoribosylamine--glycine ligase [Candidatus Micrarchaeota archaeon]